MKKICLKIIVLTLATFVFSFVSAFALSEQYLTVKIGLYYSSGALTGVDISSSGGFEAGYMDDSLFVSQFSFAETSLKIEYDSSSSIKINGTSYLISSGNFALKPLNGSVNINGKIYRGGAEFIPSSGKLTVINFVNINDYVAAVVGKEMSPSWNIEALKAQAVCARTYTIATWNKHSSQGFNLCGTQECQAYQGVSGETESTVRASSETKDLVIKYNGTIIEALYSSSNGGSSAYSKYVWGNDIPYLQAVKDDYEKLVSNPRASWNVTLTRQQIKEKLTSVSVDIGDITDFKVTGADEYGRTYEVTVYGTKGNYQIKNDKTRNFFGLYSQNYTITPSGGNETLYVIASGGVEIADSYVIQGESTLTESSPNVSVMGASGIKTYTSSNSDSYVINGSGWGHGVGMSQYGAKAMAEQGFSYHDIITFYYKDVTIE